LGGIRRHGAHSPNLYPRTLISKSEEYIVESTYQSLPQIVAFDQRSVPTQGMELYFGTVEMKDDRFSLPDMTEEMTQGLAVLENGRNGPAWQ
jgi:hypothetical protein